MGLEMGAAKRGGAHHLYDRPKLDLELLKLECLTQTLLPYLPHAIALYEHVLSE